MGLGRILLWLNVFVVPTVVICVMAGLYVGVAVGVVSFLNAWYFDRKVRPKLEKISRLLDKFLRSWD